jgi:hypothetical protein
MTWVKARFDGTLRWSIWNGARIIARDLASLNEQQKDYPHRTVFSHEYLVDRIASDWTWRDETDAEINDSVEAQAQPHPPGDVPDPISRLRDILSRR